MRRAIEDIQDFGIEVDIWKIEGVDEREDAEMLAEQTRTGEGREGVICVLLGRGASDEKVEHWLRAGRAGRGLHRLRDRPLDLVGRAQGLPRRLARRARPRPTQIADNYLRFIARLRGAGDGGHVAAAQTRAANVPGVRILFVHEGRSKGLKGSRSGSAASRSRTRLPIIQLVGHRPPEAAVVGLAAVVAHHVEAARRAP